MLSATPVNRLVSLVRLWACVAVVTSVYGSGPGMHDALYRVSISGGHSVDEAAATGFFEAVQLLGKGTFRVRQIRIETGQQETLLLAYPVGTNTSRPPSPRHLYRASDSEEDWIECATEAELLSKMWLKRKSEKATGAELGELLNQAIFAGTGSARGDSIIRKDSQLYWSGTFDLPSGVSEAVKASFPIGEGVDVVIERNGMSGRAGVARDFGDAGYELWNITSESTWRPPKRYQFLYRVACMGAIQMKYELGRRLVLETDEAAKAEGVRWLIAAADDGSVDAANELEVVEQAGGRTDQARDSVRKHRCGAPSRFMNVR